MVSVFTEYCVSCPLCGCEPGKPLHSRREQFPITFPEVSQNFSVNHRSIFKLKQTNKNKTQKFSAALKCLILFHVLVYELTVSTRLHLNEERCLPFRLKQKIEATSTLNRTITRETSKSVLSRRISLAVVFLKGILKICSLAEKEYLHLNLGD